MTTPIRLRHGCVEPTASTTILFGEVPTLRVRALHLRVGDRTTVVPCLTGNRNCGILSHFFLLFGKIGVEPVTLVLFKSIFPFIGKLNFITSHLLGVPWIPLEVPPMRAKRATRATR